MAKINLSTGRSTGRSAGQPVRVARMNNAAAFTETPRLAHPNSRGSAAGLVARSRPARRQGKRLVAKLDLILFHPFVIDGRIVKRRAEDESKLN